MICGKGCFLSSFVIYSGTHAAAGNTRPDQIYKTEGALVVRRRPDARAVNGVSLDINAGETLGLVGESGCGKSTLGRMVLRLIEPTSGSVRFQNQDVLKASSATMWNLRREMQIIFQDPFASLNPRMKVLEIVTEPLVIHQDGKRSKGQLAEAAAEMMHAVGLEESALRRYPHEFSGGQRQRIGIARALMLRPKLIVCDEPVSALDVRWARRLSTCSSSSSATSA